MHYIMFCVSSALPKLTIVAQWFTLQEICLSVKKVKIMVYSRTVHVYVYPETEMKILSLPRGDWGHLPIG